MTQVRTTLLDITELEYLDLKTEEIDGKRHYIDSAGEAYPSVTTVTGWEKRAFFAEWRKNNPEESKLALYLEMPNPEVYLGSIHFDIRMATSEIWSLGNHRIHQLKLDGSHPMAASRIFETTHRPR